VGNNNSNYKNMSTLNNDSFVVWWQRQTTDSVRKIRKSKASDIVLLNSQAWIYKRKTAKHKLISFRSRPWWITGQENEDILIANENIQKILTYLYDGNVKQLTAYERFESRKRLVKQLTAHERFESRKRLTACEDFSRAKWSHTWIPDDMTAMWRARDCRFNCPG